MKIAFLILAHRGPEQVLRLVDRLDGAGSSFFIHVDRRASSTVFETITASVDKRKNIHLTNRHSCRWGRFGIVAATFECIRAALGRKATFDYAILLSGQDYPIKSRREISDFLTVHRGKQFIESFRLDLPNRWSPDKGVWQPMNKVTWYTIGIRGRRVHIPFRRHFPKGLLPWGGSQWWCLTRECLAYIDAFATSNSKVMRYFHGVFIPDESLFQTIVSNSDFSSEIISDDLHYTDWTRPNPAVPKTLDASDFERLSSSHKLFARKFDTAHDRKILDLIDNNLLLCCA